MNIVFLKLAFRNIFRNKFYSLINILGFSIGIATTLFIFLFVHYETGFDSFHKEGNAIYRVTCGYKMKGQENNMGFAWHPVAPDLMSEIPGIGDFCRISAGNMGKMYFNKQIQKIDKISFADANLFNFFDFELIAGDPNTALDSPDKLVISQSQAQKIFGSINPLGQSLMFDQKLFMVAGIFNDLPKNSHIQSDIFISIKHVEQDKETYWLGWAGGMTFLSYLKLENGVEAARVEEKFDDFLYERYNKAGEKSGFSLFLGLQNIRDIHLNSSHLQYDCESNRNKVSLYIVSSICLLILVLAIINYITFYIAQKAGRKKEIGILKIHGAEKYKLAFHTFTEVALISLFAAIVSIGFLKIFLPLLNSYLKTSVSISGNLILTFGFLLTTVLFLSLVVTIISNSNLLKLNVVNSLRDALVGGSTQHISQNMMLAIQFCVVIFLIAAGLVITRQNRFLLNQELGFNKENILSVSTDFEFKNDEMATFKEELKRLPEIQVASLSSQPIGNGLTQNGYFFERNSDIQMFNVLYTDADFLACFDVELTSGRNFKEDSGLEDNTILVNQKLVEHAGWDEPLHQKIFRGKPLEVIGTINDFNFASLEQHIKPMLVLANPAFDGWRFMNVNIRYQTNDIRSLMKKIAGLWEKRFPNTPYEITFLDDQLARNYESLSAQQKIVALFSSLAIFIACMGLFGLTLLVTKQRTKEIGIRKVNGAKVTEILAMLNKDFLKWIAIAFVIACPLAYYAMFKWLENFAYKTTLSWWIFALAGVLALGIALLTVSWQSWRAATRNPVEALRYE